MTGVGLSQRLRRVIDALPLDAGTRVLEVGGAPGAAARDADPVVEDHPGRDEGSAGRAV